MKQVQTKILAENEDFRSMAWIRLSWIEEAELTEQMCTEPLEKVEMTCSYPRIGRMTYQTFRFDRR